MGEIYATMAIRTFALSIISIFVPIFLYKIGYSILEIIVFEIVLYAIVFLMFLLGVKLSNKIGIKHTILLSVPFAIATFVILKYLDYGSGLLYLIAAADATSRGLFWAAMHLNFSEASDKKKEGVQVGLFHSISATLAIVAPLVGGLLATYAGFGLTFIIVSVILFASAVPLFFTKDRKSTMQYSVKELVNRKHITNDLAYLGTSFRFVGAGVFWPLFIFISGIKVVAIGSIYTVVHIFRAITTIIVGKSCDKHNKGTFVKIGAIIHGTSIMVRGFVTGIIGVGAVTIWGGIGNPILDVPFEAEVYQQSKKNHALEIMIREFYLFIGRLLFLAMCFFLFLVFSVKIAFIVLFIVAGSGSILQMTAELNKKPKKA
jgi:MFS family permease